MRVKSFCGQLEPEGALWESLCMRVCVLCTRKCELVVIRNSIMLGKLVIDSVSDSSLSKSQTFILFLLNGP